MSALLADVDGKRWPDQTLVVLSTEFGRTRGASRVSLTAGERDE